METATPADVEFNLDLVTPRMLVDFKTATGCSLMSLMDDSMELDLKAVPEEAIAGIVWLGLRTSGNPDATYDDALDTPFALLLTPSEENPEDPSLAD